MVLIGCFLSASLCAAEVPEGSVKAAPAASLRPLSPVERTAVAESVTVETPFTLTLDRLRREQYRAPDEDLLGRFAQASTECPPLFGSD